MARPVPQIARELCPRVMILAVVLLLVVGGAQILAQQVEPTPEDGSDGPRKATLLDPPDLVILSTGEVKGALAPGG